LCGYETWYLTLREEHRLRVLEYRFLRDIFRPKRNEVIGRWRKLRIQKLHNLYSSPNIIRIIKTRRIRWDGKDSACSTHEGEEECMQDLTGKPEAK
jgi:hypothetical protein